MEMEMNAFAQRLLEALTEADRMQAKVATPKAGVKLHDEPPPWLAEKQRRTIAGLERLTKELSK